jgi:hypothetical protein
MGPEGLLVIPCPCQCVLSTAVDLKCSIFGQGPFGGCRPAARELAVEASSRQKLFWWIVAAKISAIQIFIGGCVARQ